MKLLLPVNGLCKESPGRWEFGFVPNPACLFLLIQCYATLKRSILANGALCKAALHLSGNLCEDCWTLYHLTATSCRVLLALSLGHGIAPAYTIRQLACRNIQPLTAEDTPRIALKYHACDGAMLRGLLSVKIINHPSLAFDGAARMLLTAQRKLRTSPGFLPGGVVVTQAAVVEGCAHLLLQLQGLQEGGVRHINVQSMDLSDLDQVVHCLSALLEPIDGPEWKRSSLQACPTPIAITTGEGPDVEADLRPEGIRGWSVSPFLAPGPWLDPCARRADSAWPPAAECCGGTGGGGCRPGQADTGPLLPSVSQPWRCCGGGADCAT